MMRSLWTAASGMGAQQVHMDVIANNLANVNTVGFKKSSTDFQDLIYQNIRYPGALSTANTELPTGIQIGLGVRPIAVQKLFHQGNFQMTGNELDLAVEGIGFFKVTLPTGETAYTRDGNFSLNSEGIIVNSDGYPLEPTITIPADATAIAIGTDGTVSVKQPGQSAFATVGNIELTRFTNPAGLLSIGRNAFQPTDASGDPTDGTPGEDGMGTVTQGYLEMSNIDMVTEMVDMIVAQRAYEINSKAIVTSDEMLRMVNGLKR